MGWVQRVFLLIPAAALGCSEAARESTLEADAPQPVRLVDVTEVAGLSGFRHVTGAYGERLFPETMGSGVAFLDFDGDDWLDLLVVGGGTWPGHGEPTPALWLFRNNADGTFRDVTADVGLDGIEAYGFGLAVADIDQDGDADFYVTTLYENLLFRNDPDSAAEYGRRFTEIAAAAGVDGGPRWSTSAAFFPADGDHYPDLYVANYVPWTPATDRFCSVDGTTKSYCTPVAYEGLSGTFYRNNGDGTFSDWTERAGFTGSPGKSLGVVPLDYDRDGWTDLMVTNDVQRDLLYHNQGDGTFVEVGLLAGVAFSERGRARAGMGVDAGVVDRTGHESIFIGNFSNETLGVYRRSQSGVFEERAAATGLAMPSTPTLTFGLLLFDVDLDGDLDLYAANGHVQDDVDEGSTGHTYRQAPHLFINNGDGVFRDVVMAIPGPFGNPAVLRGAAVGDFDRDGDLDLVTTENGGPLMLWRNDSRGGRSVRIEPLHASGSPALGARVELYTGDDVQQRYIRTGHSYLSSSEAVATFGVGAHDRADSVRIVWPGGATEVWTDVASDRTHRLIQGSTRAAVAGNSDHP